MTNLDQMAHEYALQILKNITPDRGYISGLTIERIAETAYGLAEAMRAESKECGGVPDAILEATKETCHHFSTTFFADGKATCFDCGAIVNDERDILCASCASKVGEK